MIRLSIAGPNEHWREEPWAYAKAVKWYEDENEAIAEAHRLNGLQSDPLDVYFVSYPKAASKEWPFVLECPTIRSCRG